MLHTLSTLIRRSFSVSDHSVVPKVLPQFIVLYNSFSPMKVVDVLDRHSHPPELKCLASKQHMCFVSVGDKTTCLWRLPYGPAQYLET